MNINEILSQKNEEKIQIVVECSLSKEEANLINQIGKIKQSIPCINAYIVEVDKNDLPKLKGIKSLKSFHSNTHITAQMNNARKTVNADSAQNKGFSGKNVTIAILDTGIAPLNDFIYPKNRIICFKDFINDKSEPYDDNGHGTHLRLTKTHQNQLNLISCSLSDFGSVILNGFKISSNSSSVKSPSSITYSFILNPDFKDFFAISVAFL